MANMDDFFNKLKRKHPTLLDDIRAIFKINQNDSPQRSITLSQLRAAYHQRTGWDFPVKGGTRTQLCFLLTIPYISCFSSQIGTLRFFLIEAKSE
ncbi:hypothetical protein KR018_012471 [Drosophila ironensis]|nr:hypothetical protein KR018_012471 [Drosophila ironensis]